MRISMNQYQAQYQIRLLLSLSVYLLAIQLVNLINAQRVSEKIYSNLQSDHYCSRRLNATHQVGCQSDLGGNLGVVWIIEDSHDLDHVLKTGPTPPYMAVLRKSLFSRKVILDFKNNPGRVSGVVFLDKEHDESKSRLTPFSPDDVCPNRYSGIYVNDTQYGDCKHAWQNESPVSGLLYEDIPFPIFLINDIKSIEKIESCFKVNNVIVKSVNGENEIDTPPRSTRTQSSYPLCGIHLDSFMLAAKDSLFCLNSHFLIDEILQSNAQRCRTVYGQNIFGYYKTATGPLQPSKNSKYMTPEIAPPESVVLLAAKLSSISMFSDISPGADSTITSIITLLAVAEALGRVKNSTAVIKSKRNIAFAVLDSEPFDYTGSSRMVHNMIHSAFPGYAQYDPKPNQTDALLNLNLSSIDYIINLDQMANYPSSEAIYFHSDPHDIDNTKLDNIYKTMVAIAKSEKVNFQRSSGLPLPPTSVQEFIRQARSSDNPDNNKFAGLVLSNYDKKYNNLLYHSIYDDSHNINQTSNYKLLPHLVQVSTFIARSLYEIAFGGASDHISVNQTIVGELLDCYLKDAHCHLFTRVSPVGQRLPEGSVPTYKDPARRSDDVNAAITGDLLAYFIGDPMVGYNFSECLDDNFNSLNFTFSYINNQDKTIDDVSLGMCLRSQVFRITEESPAYIIKDDEIALRPNYPAWTVSYNSIRNPVRLYLIPSPVSQWCLFLLGIIVTVASFVIVRHVRDSLSYEKSNNDMQTATST
uniref:Nicastrin n=1 Tax=Aceria tosichella TaxID=561515 RepID=A0A6G1S4R1_9ACAR